MTRIKDIQQESIAPSGNDWLMLDEIASDTTKKVRLSTLSAQTPVQSVAGRTGNITVTSTDVGLGNVQNVDTTNASNISSGTLNTALLPSVNIGTTSVDLTRASGPLALTGVSLDAMDCGTY